MEMLKHSLEVNSFSADSNKTGNMSEKKSHRRTKRFLSYPRFVEVMVVADSRMVAYHGANLQHYVLTLMSIVSIQLRGVDSSVNHFLLVTVSPFCCALMQYPQFGSARHGDNGGVRVKLGWRTLVGVFHLPRPIAFPDPSRTSSIQPFKPQAARGASLPFQSMCCTLLLLYIQVK